MVGKRKLFVDGTCNYNLGRDMRGKCRIITSSNKNHSNKNATI